MSLISIIIALLAVLVGVMVWRANQAGPPIEEVRKGGRLMLRGFGPSGEDVEVTIFSRHLYSEDDETWIELEGECQFGPISVNLEASMPVSVDVTIRKLTFDDIKLSEEKIAAIEKADEGSFLFEGTRYEYEDWGKAVYHEHGNLDSKERLKYWEFESEDGNTITVEHWEDGSIECFLAKELPRSEVRVWSTTGES